MALYPRAASPSPDVVSFFSHSYGDGSTGAFDQTGRMDAALRQRLDCEFTNWNKYAIAGSRLTCEGANQGGWATLWRHTSGGKYPGRAFPYVSEGGALFMVFGINDLGTLGGATTQLLAAYQGTLTACISRWRASTIAENDAASGVLQPTYGGTWTAETGKFDISSSGTERFASTTSGTITWTLPADYTGEPVVLNFIGRSGVNGGIVTFSGTAGVTGTITTDNVMPSASLSNCPVIKRITNLTSANASQTIIATVTQNSGLVYFDCAWLESKTPPPIIVANCPRLTASGYSVKYPTWNGAPILGSCDADVNALNSNMATAVAGFDGMVQIADLDGRLNKDTTLFFDGLHPNERGAAMCADAMAEALARCSSPTPQFGPTGAFNPPSRKAASRRMPHRSGLWYTTDFQSVGTSTAPTAGDMYAYPFYVTEARTKWNNWGLEVTAAGTGATCAVRFGMYYDSNFEGYPNTLLQEVTVATVMTVATAGGTGLKTNNGSSFVWSPDPGLYWLVFKYDSVTAGSPVQTHAYMTGPVFGMPQVASTGLISTATGRGLGWKLTGQAAGVFPNTFPVAATLINTGPYFGIQRA